jgi:hypothetical protein
MKKKKLITTLIKDHLIMTRLTEGLQQLGLQGDYTTHASDLVFKLLGIESCEEEEELFVEFLDWSKEVAKVDIYKFPGYLDIASKAIYRKLKTEIKYIEEAKTRKK